MPQSVYARADMTHVCHETHTSLNLTAPDTAEPIFMH